jgi:CheY-like chemotaxis protein
MLISGANRSQTLISLVVADDDEDDCLLTREALAESQLSCDVHFVHNGEQLLDYLKCQGNYARPGRAVRPDLVLLDLNMPRKDGREALREIKADPLLRNIPVVVLTTSSAHEDVHNAFGWGASGFITKPHTFEGLVKVMRGLSNYLPNLTVPTPPMPI